MPLNNGFESIPSDKIVPIFGYFLNGAVKNMNVNGSVTPQVFSFSPAANLTYYINKLHIVLADGGTPDVTDFGNGTALTNGLLFESVVNGSANTLFNVLDNGDISLMFIDHFSSPSGWLNNADLFLGSYNFNMPITLNQLNSDLLRVTVRDNITGLDAFRIAASGWRAI
jgi:hypothetical protein